jgi:hypothetical protein
VLGDEIYDQIMERMRKMKYYRIRILPGPPYPEEDDFFRGAWCANGKYEEEGKDDALFYSRVDADGWSVLICRTNGEQPDLDVFYMSGDVDQYDSSISIVEITEEDAMQEMISSSRRFRYFSLKAAKRMFGDKLPLDNVKNDYDEEYLHRMEEC